MRLRMIVVTALLFGMCSRLYAFAGDEHRRVSASGYAIALAYAEHQYKIPPPDLVWLKKLGGQGPLSYADFVVAVDHRIDPFQTMEKPIQTGGLPQAPNELDPYLSETVLHPRLANLRALSVNDMHFQGELTSNLRLLHLLATRLASGIDSSHQGYLFPALMVDAVADHLLQDFFAPGHILTPRQGLHDAVALAMHDQYNILGSIFQLRVDRLRKDVERLIPYLPQAKLYSEAADYALQDLLESPRVGLWGDGDLRQNKRQELLMILLTALSICDVFDSHYGGVVTNSFGAITFHQFGISELGFHHAYAGLPQGDYDVPYGGRLTFPIVVGASIGTSTLYTDHGDSARSTFGVDSLVFGFGFWPRRYDSEYLARPLEHQVGVSAGAVYERSRDEKVYGPKLRLFIAMPLIHSQFGLEKDWLKYRATGNRETSYELTSGRYTFHFMTGFSFLKLDLGIARDRALGDTGFRRAYSFQTGVYFEQPMLAIPGLRRLELPWLLRTRREAIPVD